MLLLNHLTESAAAAPSSANALPGFELTLHLPLAFRSIIDELHDRIAREGHHPGLRPVHGFVFQAIWPAEHHRHRTPLRLGVSKQATGKTIENLEQLGYVEHGSDPANARREVIRLTDRAVDCLAHSARIFDEPRAPWSAAPQPPSTGRQPAATGRPTSSEAGFIRLPQGSRQADQPRSIIHTL
ncbi:MarR family transcriptional regulator [Kitasatospora sp. NPDC001683]